MKYTLPLILMMVLLQTALFSQTNYALKFGSDSDFLAVPQASVASITNDLTVEAWVCPSTATMTARVIDHSSIGLADGFIFDILSGQVRLLVGNNATAVAAVGAATLSANTWYHIAGTYDGSTLRVYINGVQDGSAACAISVYDNTALQVRFGSDQNGGNHFLGQMDEVRIWNVARTAGQLGGFITDTLTGSETGLAGYWKFNDASGTTAVDAKASNNGTLMNFAMTGSSGWVNNTFSAALTSPTVTNTAGAKDTINITANWAWTASTTSSDITLSAASGTGSGTIVITENSTNATTSARKDTVIVSSAYTRNDTLVITQLSSVLVSSNSITMAQPAGSADTVSISAEGAWAASVTGGSDWLSVSPLNGSGNGSLIVTAQTALETATSRVGTITLTAAGRSNVTITVTQTLSVQPAGSGTSIDPYQIATLGNLYWLSQTTNAWNKVFRQTTDIHAGSTIYWNSGAGFSPIGNATTTFNGTYHGGGHIIKNLNINKKNMPYVGFFGKTRGCIIDSLVLAKCTVISLCNLSTDFELYVGGLVGYDSLGTLTNCSVTGTVVGSVNPNNDLGWFYIGGLVGIKQGGTSANCSAAVSVVNYSSSHFVGGLIGEDDRCNLTNCFATGGVSSSASSSDLDGSYTRVGGLVGVNGGDTLTNCYATGSVFVTSNNTYVNVGGLVGYNGYGYIADAAHGSTLINCSATGNVCCQSIGEKPITGGLVGMNPYGNLTNCSATGSVSSSNPLDRPVNTGGLIGWHQNGNLTNCYATGSIAGFSGSDQSVFYLGGLIGDHENGSLTNCYATGSIAGFPSSYVGGFLGDFGSGTLSNSFWNIETSGKTVGLGKTKGTGTAVGLTSAQMETQSTFTNAGWDFITTWEIDPKVNNGFPFLQWQKSSPATLTLPVELASFTATASNNSATLSWKTVTEVNNYGFEIERRTIGVDQSKVVSAEALYASMQWTKIGFVQGNGTSNSPHSYSFTDPKLASGTFAYRLKKIDNDGAYTYSHETQISVSMPTAFALRQNYPNPFNPSTTISFTLAQDSHVSLKIYDAVGREVATLVNEAMKAGKVHSVVFDASQFASGVYFYRLSAGNFSSVKTLVLLR